jgi:hypothetical protein
MCQDKSCAKELNDGLSINCQGKLKTQENLSGQLPHGRKFEREKQTTLLKN